eukprot:scaffold8096_cov1613-Prasinococcus_capsulatus_cf.AAC.8
MEAKQGRIERGKTDTRVIVIASGKGGVGKTTITANLGLERRMIFSATEVFAGECLCFDYVLIDAPAGIDTGFLNAITSATEAIIVTNPEITALRDADRAAGVLEATGIYKISLIVNRVRVDMIKNNDMMSVRDVQEMVGLPLLAAIPEDRNVIIATNRGQPIPVV